MTGFRVEPVPTIALAVHQATDLGEPAHEVGQGLIERQIRTAVKDYSRERVASESSEGKQ